MACVHTHTHTYFSVSNYHVFNYCYFIQIEHIYVFSTMQNIIFIIIALLFSNNNNNNNIIITTFNSHLMLKRKIYIIPIKNTDL
jgi:hypothetical protein